MRTLLIDIETAPLTVHTWSLWEQRVGLNQILDSGRTLCFAAKWVGEKAVVFDSVLKSTHAEMVSHAHQLLDAADAVIHYNGTKFDIPTLQKEFLLFGMAPPSPFKQIDLLKTARRQFKFPSNKLDYVAQALGVGSKIRHKGHELWIECMDLCPKAWKVMERYNKQDVILLEKVYNRLLPWIPNHPSVPLYRNESAPACPTCGSLHVQRRGLSRSRTGAYRRYQCQDCGTWSRSRLMEGKVDKELLVKDN